MRTLFSIIFNGFSSLISLSESNHPPFSTWMISSACWGSDSHSGQPPAHVDTPFPALALLPWVWLPSPSSGWTAPSACLCSDTPCPAVRCLDALLSGSLNVWMASLLCSDSGFHGWDPLQNVLLLLSLGSDTSQGAAPSAHALTPTARPFPEQRSPLGSRLCPCNLSSSAHSGSAILRQAALLLALLFLSHPAGAHRGFTPAPAQMPSLVDST